MSHPLDDNPFLADRGERMFSFHHVHEALCLTDRYIVVMRVPMGRMFFDVYEERYFFVPNTLTQQLKLLD